MERLNVFRPLGRFCLCVTVGGPIYAPTRTTHTHVPAGTRSLRGTGIGNEVTVRSPAVGPSGVAATHGLLSGFGEGCAMTARIRRFIAEKAPATPCLIMDLDKIGRASCKERGGQDV